MPKAKVLATITIEYCTDGQVHVAGPVDNVALYRKMMDTTEEMVRQVHEGTRIIKPSLAEVKTIGAG